VGRYGRSHLVTLMKRHSRFLMVLPVPDATSPVVVAAATTAFQRLPETMRRSLTWDRGIEMTRHQDFTTETGIPVYFCNAYSPWQRGSNENTAAPVLPTCMSSSGAVVGFAARSVP